MNMRPQGFRSLLYLLTTCLVLITTAAPTIAQLRVFRGTLVHSKVPTLMEVLQDHLIGFEGNSSGRVSTSVCKYQKNAARADESLDY